MYTYNEHNIRRSFIIMNNTSAKVFGEMMRKSRTARRMPQERLAEIVGISVTYCREIEHGKYTPTWIIWLKICKLLDIDIDDLYERYVMEETDEPA